MAPRRRQAASRGGAAAASLASLPDALLERIIGLLQQRDRHRAALVSRQWHAAAHSPAVLIKRGASLWSRRHGLSTQLRSFAAWLARHGQHLHRVYLSCSPKRQEAEPCTWELASCLSACAAAAAGSLQDLSVGLLDGDAMLCVTSWCAELQQLTRLSLNAIGDLRISSSLAGLTAVTDLSLEGNRVSIDAAAQLPPNVEQLKLSDSSSAALPSQLSRLSRLSRMVLLTEACEPDGFAALASLSRLAALQLEDSRHLPACLPQLTALKELNLKQASHGMEMGPTQAAVDAALEQLTGLTSLCIVDRPEHCQPPAALTALAGLECLCLGSAHTYMVHQQAALAPLPPGPWAASLRSLGACLDVLQHSLAALSAATQLTRLVVIGGSFKGQAHWQFWDWAARHPPLQQVQVDLPWDDVEVPCTALHSVCYLARQRPALDVLTVPVELGDTFDEEFTFASF